jgi:hypothetical protein
MASVFTAAKVNQIPQWECLFHIHGICLGASLEFIKQILYVDELYLRWPFGVRGDAIDPQLKDWRVTEDAFMAGNGTKWPEMGLFLVN